LNRQQLEITDIFKSAYLLCSGSDLCGIRIKTGTRRIGVFLIRGNNLDKLDRAYRTGKALVNPLQLRESLNHLRDILFERLRENEGRRRNEIRRSCQGPAINRSKYQKAHHR
jgi:hypothetical protein